MQLTFAHVCVSNKVVAHGCPVAGQEVFVNSEGRNDEYIVPEVRCLHTNSHLKLVAIGGNRDF